MRTGFLPERRFAWGWPALQPSMDNEYDRRGSASMLPASARNMRGFRRLLTAILASLLLLAAGGSVVAYAQDDTPTPTASETETPTPTPIVVVTDPAQTAGSSDALPTVTVFGLTLAQWLQLAISAVVVVLVAHYGSALIVRVLRRLTRERAGERSVEGAGAPAQSRRGSPVRVQVGSEEFSRGRIRWRRSCFFPEDHRMFGPPVT